MPALDGVRALAVVAVVLFHADFGFASGGFIGVSVFFTLSGFLITSLLLAEHEQHGRISLRGFYGRRARRLLPAAYLCVALVLLAVPFWNDVQRRRLPGDAVAALANVANWRAATASLSYRELFTAAPSPLAHFWSLAIEEQCYLVMPLVVAWALRRGRGALAVAAGALTAVAIVLAWRTTDFDMAYNGTHTRVAELLVGVLLAVVLSRWRPAGWSASVAGLSGLALLTVAVVRLDLGDEWLAHGGFAVVAVATCGVVVGSLVPGRIARSLSWRPLVAIGKVSYGVYLFHWPLFLVLDEQRTGLGRLPLLVVRSAALAVVTIASYRLLEMPVRERRMLATPRPAFLAVGATVAAVLVGAWALPSPPLDATQQLLEQGNGGPVTFAPPSSSGAPPTVLVVGSNGEAVDVLAEHEPNITVTDGVQPGCPVASGVEAQLLDGTLIDLGQCSASAELWERAIADAQPDLVVVSMGAVDDGLVRPASTEQFPEPGDWTGEAVLRERARAEVIAALQRIGSDDLPVVIYWPEDPAVGELMARRVAVGPVASLGMVISPAELLEQVQQAVSATSSAEVPHVLVIGDSTSLTFAAALDLAAEGGVQVLWAGHNGCPFVRADGVRAHAGQEWSTPDCDDFSETLPPILASFRPDVVYLVAGTMELAMQRYPGDPRGHLPGSDEYRAFHDAEMAALLAVLGPDGPPVFVADSPAVGEGPFSGPELTDPARLAAFNDQVARWVQSSPAVYQLRYAELIEDHEAAHGSIRPDGSHPEVEPLAELLAASVLPELFDFLADRA